MYKHKSFIFINVNFFIFILYNLIFYWLCGKSLINYFEESFYLKQVRFTASSVAKGHDPFRNPWLAKMVLLYCSFWIFVYKCRVMYWLNNFTCVFFGPLGYGQCPLLEAVKWPMGLVFFYFFIFYTFLYMDGRLINTQSISPIFLYYFHYIFFVASGICFLSLVGFSSLFSFDNRLYSVPVIARTSWVIGFH